MKCTKCKTLMHLKDKWTREHLGTNFEVNEQLIEQFLCPGCFIMMETVTELQKTPKNMFPNWYKNKR